MIAGTVVSPACSAPVPAVPEHDQQAVVGRGQHEGFEDADGADRGGHGVDVGQLAAAVERVDP